MRELFYIVLIVALLPVITLGYATCLDPEAVGQTLRRIDNARYQVPVCDVEPCWAPNPN